MFYIQKSLLFPYKYEGVTYMEKPFFSCVRRYQFCAGHRVHLHESKCATPHGHNYVVYFHATAPRLDDIGRVIDFSVLKEKLGGWIDKNWDHNFIVYEKDEEMIKALTIAPRKKEPFILAMNPTAENMADFLLKEVCPEQLKGTDVSVNKVVLWETENCFVEASL